ncbi:hypothetical protein NC651_020935 [Populus alba x Populus x berolinensis]|nr:hypothetical protein NC651_020935 [Populus alba x Populus x berolinensis]
MWDIDGLLAFHAQFHMHRIPTNVLEQNRRPCWRSPTRWIRLQYPNKAHDSMRTENSPLSPTAQQPLFIE